MDGYNPEPLRFFAEVAGPSGPRYYFRPEALPPAPLGASGPADARRRLDPAQLKAHGCPAEPDIPDDDLAAVLAAGIVANPAFLEIADGLLVRARCFCGYYAETRRRATEVENQLRQFLGYFSQDGYLGSTAFYRGLRGCLRDVRPDEALAAAADPRLGRRDRLSDSGPPTPADRARRHALRLAPEIPGLTLMFDPKPCACATVAPADPLLAGRLWVCSTPEARRFLHRLRKACRARGLVLSIRMATADPGSFFCLRHKLRLHAVNCHRLVAEEAHPPGARDFWEAIAELAQDSGAAADGGTGKDEPREPREAKKRAHPSARAGTPGRPPGRRKDGPPEVRRKGGPSKVRRKDGPSEVRRKAGPFEGRRKDGPSGGRRSGRAPIERESSPARGPDTPLRTDRGTPRDS